VSENHPRVRAYVKNHNLGFDVPYRHGSESHVYRPDFIVLVEDGHGEDDLLHLVVEVKGYRREDAKDKKIAMESYWIPGVNNSKQFGRWAFAEFTEVFGMDADFAARVESEFRKIVDSVSQAQAARSRCKGRAMPKTIKREAEEGCRYAPSYGGFTPQYPHRRISVGDEGRGTVTHPRGLRAPQS